MDFGFSLVVFAMDFLVYKNCDSASFTCSFTCVSTWFGVTVNNYAIRPEVTLCG